MQRKLDPSIFSRQTDGTLEHKNRSVGVVLSDFFKPIGPKKHHRQMLTRYSNAKAQLKLAQAKAR